MNKKEMSQFGRYVRELIPEITAVEFNPDGSINLIMPMPPPENIKDAIDSICQIFGFKMSALSNDGRDITVWLILNK